jgi:hypothetical protein
LGIIWVMEYQISSVDSVKYQVIIEGVGNHAINIL